MAWPGGKEIDYKVEFGVENKEALLAKLAKVSELETSNTTMKASVEAQSGELNTIKETLRALELKSTETNNNNTNNNNNNNNQNVEIPSVQDNEDAAFAARNAPIWAQTLATNARLNRMEVVNRLKATDPYFPKLEKEFNELCKTITLREAGHEQGSIIIENAYNIVRGKHLDQILQDTRAGKGEFFIESGSNSGNTGNGTENRNTDPTKLTDDEKAIASRMGVSEEAFIKSKTGGINMSGALRYA